MSDRTVRELRALAKERGLKGCCKLRKAELVSLLSVSPKKSLSGEVAFLEQLEMREGSFSGFSEWYTFLGEHAEVSDAAGMCLCLSGVWMIVLFELFFGGGGGVGRSQSADALVEMTALIELCNKMTALVELCNKND